MTAMTVSVNATRTTGGVSPVETAVSRVSGFQTFKFRTRIDIPETPEMSLRYPDGRLYMGEVDRSMRPEGRGRLFFRMKGDL